MCLFIVSLCGGYSALFHLLFLFTVVLEGVGGVFCTWYCGICIFSIAVFIVSICVDVPKL